MKLHKTHGRATTQRRDPMRWKVATLVALALLGVGAMHTYVLMFRSGEDVLSALVEAGGMILIAALPVGYLVYRFWFAGQKSFNTGGAVDGEDGLAWNNGLFVDSEEGGFMCGAQGCGYYSGSTRIDDDDH